MNRSIMLAALALAACDPGSVVETPPLAGATMGGAFSLIDQDGRRVTDRDFAGKYRLVYFGFTYCPDVCPTDMQALGRGVAQFEKAQPAAAATLQPVFISVDPARDTPAVVKQFVANFHPRFVGLTGSEAEVAAAARAYAVVFQKQPANANGAYLVEHLRTATLYGPDGAPIALIPQDEGPDAVAQELARWVK
jgi:protein SCO1